MIENLRELCHRASTSGTISSLYSSVINYYNSGSIDFLFANKLIKELRKREERVYHDFDHSNLELLPISTPAPSSNFWEWEDGNTILWEAGIEMETN